MVDEQAGLRWFLDGAFISSFQTGGDATQASGLDSFSISFQTISVEAI